MRSFFLGTLFINFCSDFTTDGKQHLAKDKTAVPRPVSQYRGIDHFTATGTFPGIKGSHEIVIFFPVHASSTLWTIHIGTLLFKFDRQPQVVLA